jgi:hypothetical protein
MASYQAITESAAWADKRLETLRTVLEKKVAEKPTEERKTITEGKRLTTTTIEPTAASRTKR